ncbi:MAG TPA: TolC family protein [Verrucomicrobiae bacterium]
MRNAPTSRPVSVLAALFAGVVTIIAADSPISKLPSSDWLNKPISLADALDLALQRNSAILKSRADLEVAHGIAVQTRAIVNPKLRTTGSYQWTEPSAIDTISAPGISIPQNEHNWSVNIRLVQSIYEGGRIESALRASKLTREQALDQHRAIINDTLTDVRVAYADILLAAQQIIVQEASVKLLQRELEDNQRRYDAGTVPRFNVLRAEVEVANARPRLIRARNAHRIAKNNLANLLGYDLPKEVLEDVPLQLAGKLEEEPASIELPVAVGRALEHRPELAVLRKSESLRREDIVNAKGGKLPSFQTFVGYGWRNSVFSTDLTRDVAGWNAGAQLTWDWFDGGLTRGKLREAEARHDRAHEDIADAERRVELEVRTTYSNFIEAKEVLESQKKVQEQAEEALRLAVARSDAGTGTQLDVLNAQTALTEARTTQIQALRDYAVAWARLERAIGNNLGSQTK